MILFPFTRTKTFQNRGARKYTSFPSVRIKQRLVYLTIKKGPVLKEHQDEKQPCSSHTLYVPDSPGGMRQPNKSKRLMTLEMFVFFVVSSGPSGSSSSRPKIVHQCQAQNGDSFRASSYVRSSPWLRSTTASSPDYLALKLESRTIQPLQQQR